MIRKTLLIFFLAFPLLLPAQEVLRGELRVDLEPINAVYMDEAYPLTHESAYRRALQLAALFFSAQIYGWSFHYDIGERARGIAEEFELTPLGEIPWGDPGLEITHVSFENFVLSAWMDYRPSDLQRRHLEFWRMGSIRSAQAIGYGPLGGPLDIDDWLVIRQTALEDAARAAVRAMLQAAERNRPKQVTGFISLERFPNFFIDAGYLATQARFRIEITEIIPFAVH